MTDSNTFPCGHSGGTNVVEGLHYCQKCLKPVDEKQYGMQAATEAAKAQIQAERRAANVDLREPKTKVKKK